MNKRGSIVFHLSCSSGSKSGIGGKEGKGCSSSCSCNDTAPKKLSEAAKRRDRTPARGLKAAHVEALR